MSELTQQVLLNQQLQPLGSDELPTLFGFLPQVSTGQVVTNAQIDALRESLAED